MAGGWVRGWASYMVGLYPPLSDLGGDDDNIPVWDIGGRGPQALCTNLGRLPTTKWSLLVTVISPCHSLEFICTCFLFGGGGDQQCHLATRTGFTKEVNCENDGPNAISK